MYEASRASQLIVLPYSTVALSSSGYRTGTSAVGDSLPLSFATVTSYRSLDLLRCSPSCHSEQRISKVVPSHTAADRLACSSNMGANDTSLLARNMTKGIGHDVGEVKIFV